MNKNFLLPILLTIIPFTAFLFTHQYLIYFDTFDYLSFICNATPLTSGNPIEPILFQFLPCNFFFLKILLWTLSAISLFFIMLTSEYFWKNKGHFTGLMIIATPFWYTLFFQLETEQFAYPLLFASLYFFVKAKIKQKPAWHLAALASSIIAGILWPGSIIFLIVLGIMDIYYFLLALPLIIRYLEQLLYVLWPYGTQAIENYPGLGLIWLNWLIFGIIGIPKELLWPGAILLLISFINGKFAVLAIPFLAIGLTKIINQIEKQNPYQEKTIKKVFVSIILCLTLLNIVALSQSTPNQNEINHIQTFLNTQPEKQHKNDWQYGHTIKFLKGKPSAWSGGIWNQDYNHSIVLTTQKLNCFIIKKPTTNFIGEENSATTYNCP